MKGLLAADRLRAIAGEVRTRSSVRVVDLAQVFGVSGETIRRDLEILEREGQIKRVYGGAVDARQAPVRRYDEREAHRIEEKKAIGRLASTLVEDGDTLIVDVGTTALAFCAHLQGKRGLTVVTPSIRAAQLLRSTTEARVIVTGGVLHDEEPYLTGPVAQETILRFHVRKAFISCGGLAFESGLTDFDDAEVALRRSIVRSADQVVVLADSSKVGVRAFAVIGRLEVMDVLVTDSGVHDEVRRRLEDMGIEVLVATGVGGAGGDGSA